MPKASLHKGDRPPRFQRKPSVSVCDAAGPSVAAVRVAAAPFVAVCVAEGSLQKGDMLSRFHRRHSGAVRAAGEPCVAVRAVGKPVVAVRAVGEPVVAVRILAAGVVEFVAHDIMGFGLSPLYSSALSRSSSSETGAQARDTSHVTSRVSAHPDDPAATPLVSLDTAHLSFDIAGVPCDRARRDSRARHLAVRRETTRVSSPCSSCT